MTSFGSSHIASSAYQNWPTKAAWGGCIRSLRVDQGPITLGSPISGSTATSLQSPCYPEGNFGGNQLLDGSIGLSPLYPGVVIDLHVRNTTGFHQRFLLASPSPGIAHHLSGLILHADLKTGFRAAAHVPFVPPIHTHSVAFLGKGNLNVGRVQVGSGLSPSCGQARWTEGR